MLSVASAAAAPCAAAVSGISPPSGTDLFVRDGDVFREAPDGLILERAKRVVAARFRPGSPVLSRPDLVHLFLQLELAPRDYAVFGALLLDRRKRLIAFLGVFRGTIDGVSVHPREVLREAILRNAAFAIFARNDPCGCAEPTDADVITYHRLIGAFDLMDVRVLDYILVGENCRSLAEYCRPQ